MQRIGRRTRLKPEYVEDYKRWHREVWPEIVELTRRAGVSNYTIFMDGCDLFSYLEVEDWAAAIEMLASSPVGQRWQALMAPLMNAEDPTMPWRPLEEAYHQD